MNVQAFLINVYVSAFTLALLFLSSPALAVGCAEFEAEAEAYEGVVPRIDEDGKLRAVLMYGESSFLFPKRSLIADARRSAELKARRVFAEFLKSNFDAETVAADLTETQQSTDVNGNTSGTATELASQLNMMRQNSKATLSGIVKLDECVDTEEKYLLVQLGWKPSMSAAAADAKQAINNNVARGDQSAQVNTTDRSQPSIGKKTGVELVTLETEGRGVNLRSATNEALKAAVSQVFGEKFAAKSSVVDSVDSISVSGVDVNASAVVESASSSSAVQSETSGLIRSWTYIEKIDDNNGVKVVLSVVIPKYKSSLDANKTTIIVIEPTSGSDTLERDQMFKDFASKLHSVIEENLAQTKELSVLDRQHLTLTDQELGIISSNGNMQELAKLGNKAGGDLMLIPIIDKFKYRIDRREIGAQIIERTVYDVTLSIKVIEVATSNIVDTKNFSVKNKKIKSDEPSVDIALFLAKRAMRHVSKVVGGGYVDAYTEDRKVQPDMKVVKAASEKDFQEAKDNVKDDW